MHTIKQLLRLATEQLQHHSDTPDLDAALLLVHALEKSRAYLIAHADEFVSEHHQLQFQQYINRRSQNEPVAYIVGTKEFWSRDFIVTADTLIPRPETELLIETILAEYREDHELLVADLGTGSGVIAISLALEKPHWQIYATDKSERALAVAKENATRLHAVNVMFYLGDWLAALPDKKFNMIVSNPPYVTKAEWLSCADDVKREPVSALIAEDAGLALTTVEKVGDELWIGVKG